MRSRVLVASTLAATLALSLAPHADAAGVLPPAATPRQREQAQSRFTRGKELMGNKSYDAALAEFRASFEIVASPNTRLEIGRCLREMGKLVAAYAEFGRAAVEAKELAPQDARYARAADSATAERAELAPKLGFVTLTILNATDGTRVIIADEEIRRAAWNEPAPLAAGTTTIVVETPGHPPVKRSVTVAAGQKTSMVIDALSGVAPPSESAPSETAAPAPPPTAVSSGPSLRTWAYVAGGVGGVGLATFALFGSLDRSTYNDLTTVCGGGHCPPSKADEISSGRTKQTIANVGLAVGLLGLGTGVTLYVLSMPKSAPATNAALVVSPSWIGVRGDLR